MLFSEIRTSTSQVAHSELEEVETCGRLAAELEKAKHQREMDGIHGMFPKAIIFENFGRSQRYIFC